MYGMFVILLHFYVLISNEIVSVCFAHFVVVCVCIEARDRRKKSIYTGRGENNDKGHKLRFRCM